MKKSMIITGAVLSFGLASFAYAQAPQASNQQNADTYQQNRTNRCQALPESDRVICVKRMSGSLEAETRIFGSVEGGGILRETTITEQAPAEVITITEPVIPTIADPNVTTN